MAWTLTADAMIEKERESTQKKEASYNIYIVEVMAL